MTRVVNVRRDAAEVARATAAGLYVYVGRGRGSVWGNPFTWKPGTIADYLVPKEQCLPRFEEWLRQQADLMAQIGQLHGKVLGCWCKPAPCHGDILARIAAEVHG